MQLSEPTSRVTFTKAMYEVDVQNAFCDNVI